MPKYFASIPGVVLLVSTALFVTPIVRAESFSSINIDYASGSACWGRSCVGATEIAAFSGSGFTLNFSTFDSGAGSPYAFSAVAGQPFPDDFFDGRFSQGTSSQNDYFSGTFTEGGQTYEVGYAENPYVELLGSGTVPNGYGTLVFPAVLTGGGTACTDGTSFYPGSYSCIFAPGQTPSFIADVNFDVPGILTVHFSPASQPVYAYGSEYYEATFTALPEPASGWMAVGGLLAILWMASRRFSGRQARKMSAAIAASFLGAAVTFGCLAKASENQKADSDLTHVVRMNKTYSHSGDSITVEEVRGPAETWVAGNTYEVTGTYHLASHENAMLAAFVTVHSLPDVHPSPTPEQTVVVLKGEGRFTLRFHMWQAGDPHISFYPVGGGNDFGGIYF